MIKAQDTKAVRQRAKEQTRALLEFKKEWETRYLSCYCLEWYYKGNRPDDDNVLTRCKAIKDGMCDALGINDKDLTCKGIEIVYNKELAGSVFYSIY